MTETRKTEYVGARTDPTQWARIRKHCARLNVSMGSRILELFRQDILAHHHFDIQIEIGPIRRPRQQ